MIVDSHIHSMASPDSTMPPEEIINNLKIKGFGCVFSEHIEFNELGEPFFCADLDIYPSEYVKYKSDSVGLGFELSLMKEIIELNRQHAINPSLDYVIGSIHWVDGFDMGANAERTKEWFESLGEEAYCRYLNDSLEMVETYDFFDSFGHIDYISRYSTLPEKNVFYERYAEQYDRLFKALIERDKVMELCTRRLHDKIAQQNLFNIYKRYHELGGCYVTLGSDAHVPDQLGVNFDIALEMINEIGLSPVYFKERKLVKSFL